MNIVQKFLSVIYGQPLKWFLISTIIWLFYRRNIKFSWVKMFSLNFLKVTCVEPFNLIIFKISRLPRIRIRLQIWAWRHWRFLMHPHTLPSGIPGEHTKLSILNSTQVTSEKSGKSDKFVKLQLKIFWLILITEIFLDIVDVIHTLFWLILGLMWISKKWWGTFFSIRLG